MSAALLSEHWFRVAQLKPALRRHARVHRHVYRGSVWYVVNDQISGDHYRFNPAAYEVIRQLDGTRTLQQIWDQIGARLHDNSPTQGEIIRVLGQLNAADLLTTSASANVTEVLDRGGKRRRRKLLARFLNPMSLRIPLWDPDRFLSALAAWTRWLRAAPLAIAWIAFALPLLLLVPAQWPELTQNFSERLLASENLWVMALAFPLLKLFHELAHGLAVKRGGGEVHEMGLMLLVFYPVPYVDASAAHAFPSKWRRIWVGAAGMGAELWIAMLAFYVWLLLDPGFARSVAYNVVVLGSVTTVVFNANPLLRYDGYYMLSDVIEIPNLGQRSTQYWRFLATRYLFGIREPTPFPGTRSERRWFFWYAPLAFVYRLAVTLAIAWFIAQQYFVFGVLFAIWSLLTGFVVPVAKALAALFTDPRFVARAGRVWSTLGTFAAVVALALFAVPLPYHTRVEGVVWLPEKALLRASADGFVHALHAASGDTVREGDPVAELVNPLLAAQLAQQQARVEEVQARLDAAWSTRPVEAGKLVEELGHETAVLERLQGEAARLVARSPTAGRLLIDRAQDAPGRFVRKGELMAYVVGPHAPIVRIVVPQPDVDRVRSDARAADVRLAHDIATALPAELTRAVPKAARELPSAALGQAGGGRHVVDPRDERSVTAIDALFEFELSLPADLRLDSLGGRAYVSIEHGAEAIGWRWLRALRLALLSKLDI